MRTPDIRWKEHYYKLQRGQHGNVKLQNAWNKYGEKAFVFNVLYECSNIDELNTLEEHYVDNNLSGYNLRGGGHNKKMSIESRKKLSLSKRGKPNGQKGSKRTPFSKEQRAQYSRKKRPLGYSAVVDPMGIMYTVENVKEFSRQHNLVFSGVASLFSKNPCFHYKGWRIATPDTIGVAFTDMKYSKSLNISRARRKHPYPLLKSSTGDIYSIEDTLTHFCRVHKLSAGNVSSLINGKKSSYNGWTVYNPTEK